MEGRFNGTAVTPPTREGSIMETALSVPCVIKVTNDGDQVLTLTWKAVFPLGQDQKKQHQVSLLPGSDILIVLDGTQPVTTPLTWQGQTFGRWQVEAVLPG